MRMKTITGAAAAAALTGALALATPWSVMAGGAGCYDGADSKATSIGTGTETLTGTTPVATEDKDKKI